MNPADLIRVSVSLVMLLFGLDQFINPKPWTKMYLPKFFRDLPTFGTTHFMRIHALGNISLALIFLSSIYLNLVTLLVLAWWITILPFALYADWRIALRDFAIIAALLSLVI